MNSYYVYRQFDSAGSLLYVGMTRKPAARMGFHRRNSPWGSQIANVQIDEFSTRASAQSAEKQVIQIENPIYNKRSRVPEKRTPNQCVKRSITLPKELVSHVERKARKQARRTGQRPNFSGVLMDLVIADREQLQKTA